jgi:hypothetical protein
MCYATRDRVLYHVQQYLPNSILPNRYTEPLWHWQFLCTLLTPIAGHDQPILHVYGSSNVQLHGCRRVENVVSLWSPYDFRPLGL